MTFNHLEQTTSQQSSLGYDEKKNEHHHIEIRPVDVFDVEKGTTESRPSSPIDIDEGFDPVFLKKTIRKVDWRLLPVLSAMYCVSLMDRSNLSLARAANKQAMHKELRLDIGQRYTLATLAFFFPYICLEIPSQIGLRKFGARWWLGGATFLWGVSMIAMGFTKNYQALAGTRAMLGGFEAALFPGAAYLIACWYPRKMMAFRTTIFYQTANTIAGLSAIVAYGISMLHGKAGLSGWRWIFIFYGLLTVTVACVAMLFVSDFPDKARFLTPEERTMIVTRIERDRADSTADKLTLTKIRHYLLEPKIWLFGFFFCSTTLGAYALAYFLPRLLKSMGFDDALSQLLVAPPSVFTVVPALITSKIADKYKLRSWMVAFNALLVVIGTLMFSQLGPNQKAARYVGVFLCAAGCNSNISHVLSWAQTSIRSQSKRGFTSALVVAWGGIGGILASTAFQEREALKGYPTGVWLTIAMNMATVVGCVVLQLIFRYQNRRADQGKVVLEGDVNFRYQ